MKRRSSGVLCHITSLPCKYGIGDLGPWAYKFADFLAQAGQSYWQVLPLNRPAIEIPHSPYNCLSAYAGNPLLISPELLLRQGLLRRKDIRDATAFPKNRVDYESVIPYKRKLLDIAYERFKSMPKERHYKQFCMESSGWLEDFAIYVALREHFWAALWCDWPAEFKDRNKVAPESLSPKLQDAINREKFLQYQFFNQWFALKRYCNKREIDIIGDMPIYVSFDSADVWARPEFFKLTDRKSPRFVSGVPPDFFNKTGQLWGNPVYDWPALRKAGYSWWLERIGHNLRLFDILRIDHFRGFVAYWQVRAGNKTAAKGRWIRVPKEDFFEKLFGHFSSRAMIVEDLGHITPAVRAFIEKSQLAGMRILPWGFDGDTGANVHAPGNHVENCVVYTGTHDCNTIKGWFEKEAGAKQKEKLFDYLGREAAGDELHWELIRLAMSSVANLAIIPMQDILWLGEEARMNRPGTFDKNNWAWRFGGHNMTVLIIDKLKKVTQIHGRA